NMQAAAQPGVRAFANLTPVLQFAASLVLDVLLAFVMAPFGVAMQRKILLRESPTGFYFGGALAPARRRYFLATIFVFGVYQLISLIFVPVLYFLYGVDALDAGALAAATHSNQSLRTITLALVYLLFFLGAIAVARCALLFPAAALDSPGA